MKANLQNKQQNRIQAKSGRCLGLISLVILVVALLVFGFIAFATTYALVKERSNDPSAAIISACKPIKDDVAAHSVCLATNSSIYSVDYNALLTATLVSDGSFVLLLVATLNQIANLRQRAQSK